MPSVNAYGQPVGEDLPRWTPRPLPPRTALTGRLCQLEPLDPASHADALHAAYAEAPDARDWTYLPHDREPDRSAFHTFIAQRATTCDPLHMAILCDGEALGAAALMRVDATNGVMEIGHIHFAPRLRRTAAATEAIALLMRRAFDELGYRRLEWKCDSLNEASRRAAARLGFTFEGIFRQAIVTKARSRDTAWYALTNKEWPAVRRALDRWLAADNFDGAGRQKQTLEALKGGDA